LHYYAFILAALMQVIFVMVSIKLIIFLKYKKTDKKVLV